MLILLLANNFFTLFLGWELIGLTSFFLINFWSLRRGTLKSSFKAFIFNLASDIFLLISLCCFYLEFNSTDCEFFLYFFLVLDTTLTNTFYIGVFSLVMCSAIKSVQLFGHLWLPDSMEAPVPASALIHSATLVSAGLYLLNKFSVLYLGLLLNSTLIFIGSITAAYGGVVAGFQTDLKKLLAYSTMSHCGFLWVLSVTDNIFAMFIYLFLHGFFKALTFYCAGSFIFYYGTQDSRWMGVGNSFLRLDAFLLIMCALNLSGLPFSIGYFYKFYFLYIFSYSVINLISLGFLIIGMLSSIVYFFRLTHYVIFDINKGVELFNFNTILLSKVLSFTLLRFANINTLVAVVFLTLQAFFVYILGVFFFSSAVFNISFTLTGLEFNWLFITQLFNVYYVYFYTLYFLLFINLFLINSTKNTYYTETIFFFSIFFFIFLWCGVISWRKVAV